MRSKAEIISGLLDPGLIAVIRLPRAADVLPVCEALLDGGLRALEITMTVPKALEAIREARERLPGEAIIGAGSVISAEMCRAALNAGAEFVVSPITRREIAEVARAAEKPVMLGAYTPTEAQTAHEAGADFVKIFPAETLGPSYIKALLAPLPHLRVVPTGGVDLKTAPQFLKAGCAALGVGSSLLKPDLIKAADWKGLSRLARAFVEVVRNAK